MWTAALTACQVVTVPAADQSPPVIKMDIYGTGEPDAQFLDFSDCCTLRRTVGLANELTIMASAEDPDSGVQTVEIVGVTISECTVTRSFSGGGRVPNGPPVGRTLLREVEHVLASSGGSGSPGGSAPQTRLANGKTHLNDLAPQPCGQVTYFFRDDPDDPPTPVVVAEQSTIFCGVRFFARGTNGVGGTRSTATGLLLEGPPQSGAFPCASVPF